jgi:hypothetical protein
MGTCSGPAAARGGVGSCAAATQAAAVGAARAAWLAAELAGRWRWLGALGRAIQRGRERSSGGSAATGSQREKAASGWRAQGACPHSAAPQLSARVPYAADRQPCMRQRQQGPASDLGAPPSTHSLPVERAFGNCTARRSLRPPPRHVPIAGPKVPPQRVFAGAGAAAIALPAAQRTRAPPPTRCATWATVVPAPADRARLGPSPRPLGAPMPA